MRKKPKITRQVQDNSFDNIAPIGGSAPSPVASQMSNMSNSNKFVKMLGGRDRGRKSKVLKVHFHSELPTCYFSVIDSSQWHKSVAKHLSSLRCLLGSWVQEILGHSLRTRLVHMHFMHTCTYCSHLLESQICCL